MKTFWIALLRSFANEFFKFLQVRLLAEMPELESSAPYAFTCKPLAAAGKTDDPVSFLGPVMIEPESSGIRRLGAL